LPGDFTGFNNRCPFDFWKILVFLEVTQGKVIDWIIVDLELPVLSNVVASGTINLEEMVTLG
jgi:hypothetical protein